MSLRYHHLLIPAKHTFIPSSTQVRQFMSLLVQQKVVPKPVAIRMITPSNRTRAVRNPFTKQEITVTLPDQFDFETLIALESTIKTLANYRAEISGFGRPELPPLPVETLNPYAVVITCAVSSTLRSMSDVHEECGIAVDVPSFRQPIEKPQSKGFFTNPSDMTLMKQQNSGCAHFWVEFHIGNGHFPIFRSNSPNLLDPKIGVLATESFGTRFVEGCHWG